MGTLIQAAGILRNAERGLRELIAAAAARGEYDDLPRLAEWAKQLSALLNRQQTLAGSRESTAPGISANSDEDMMVQGKQGLAATRGGRINPGAKGTAGRKTKKSEYPKFFREGDVLVKVGWSKGERKTYEHKAPRRVLDTLVQTLVRVGKGGQRFVMDGLLPLKDRTDNSDIPDYQAYLTLAWLRDAGLLVQHGRQGYSLPPDSNLAQEVEHLWATQVAR
jgi:hypothetical protein